MGAAPVLSKPKPGESMCVYLSVFVSAVNSVLNRETEAIQRPCIMSGAGIVLTSPDDTEVEYALRFQFKAINNEAKYKALLAGLRLAPNLKANSHSNSIFIVNMINNTYEVKGKIMGIYLQEAQCLESLFTNFTTSQIPWSQTAEQWLGQTGLSPQRGESNS
ncbi:hypothetical protein L3X38_003443 [Prunus dulcis]|uniref:Uncharacterized protein n=1 Tax=Prunus dulcis TaxID=3755 RepID=A0AAD5F1X7_PRUDU|nr:hypothetical protein L3X38_003443 [Prunus dulcis]